MSVSTEKLTELTQELLTFYQDKKFVKADELMDKIEKHKVTPEQIEIIYNAFNEKNIDIIDTFDEVTSRDDDLLNQLEKEVSMDDPVKVYLKISVRLPFYQPKKNLNLLKR